MVDSKEMYDFKKFVEQLQSYRGRGTEFISVYITPKYSISDIVGKLRDEAGQASNIKSTRTRQNVTSSLEKIMQFLKNFKEPPKNGMAVFAGNVSEQEGKTDIQLFSIEPPFPLTTQFYRCESTFVVQPLLDLVSNTDVYGILVVDGKDATVATLQGKQMRVLKHFTNFAQAKTTKGGSSAARYQRVVEEENYNYYKKVAETANQLLSVKGLKGLIVGGPGPVKDSFLKLNLLNYQMKVLGVVDTGYADEYGLREVLEKSEGIIAEQEAIRERKILQKFLREVTDNGLAAYGVEDIRAALNGNKASMLLVTENLNLKEVALECPKCAHAMTSFTTPSSLTHACPKCGTMMKIKDEKDVVSELEEIALAKKIPIEVISADTPEGGEFLGTFRGLGVFLRYK